MSAAFWLYLHPLAALLAATMLGYLAVLGLRARQVRRSRDELLGRHARLGPYVYAMLVTNWLLGAISVWLGRNDIDFAGTGHFEVGCYLVALSSASAVSSRYLDRVPNGRTLHPLLGVAAVLLCGFQLFLGLQIMPK